MMKIFSVLLLVPAIAAFAPFLAVRNNKKPSTSAPASHALGSGGMDPRKSISAVPSFEEYLKQREAGGASSATAACAIPGNGYLDTLSAGGSGSKWKETAVSNTVERAPVDEVVEERREVVEERREAVVADGTMERGKQPVQRGGYKAPSSDALGDFLIQRAIQQQLYYSAQLGNEPMVHWLKRFQDHQHLDSYQRGEGRCGFPGTYSATFDQLNTPFIAYLEALGTLPDSSIEVSFVKPQRRLSARERANPFLNNQPPVIEIYDQPIIIANIMSQLLNTADALVETWAFHFKEAERVDLVRLVNDRTQMKGLPSAMDLEHAALMRGGETAYSRLTGDEAMPLYGFDCRACDRFDTLRALSLLVDEVTALTPETAFDVAYLRREVAEDDVAGDGGDVNVNELILKRRKARRAKFERGFVTGDDITKGEAARAAALSFLQNFCNEWVPKLVKGDARSSIVKGEYRHAPGMKEIRPENSGVDSDEPFEELWEYGDDAVQKMRGGELVLPGLMGQRLREIRAAVAAESRGTLMELVGPELRKARIEYTDYVEADGDGLGTYERWQLQAKVDGSNRPEDEAYSTAAIIAEMSIDM